MPLSSGQLILATGGIAALNSSGEEILAAAGGVCNSCCMLQLIRCSNSANSGIGLRLVDMPIGATVGSVVLYDGDCYTIGALKTGLTPSSSAATLLSGCSNASCPCPGTGSNCTGRSVPTNLTVTVVISGVTSCGCAAVGNPTFGYANADDPNGIYNLTLAQVGTSSLWRSIGNVIGNTYAYTTHCTGAPVATSTNELAVSVQKFLFPTRWAISASVAPGTILTQTSTPFLGGSVLQGCADGFCLPVEIANQLPGPCLDGSGGFGNGETWKQGTILIF